jgi:hypothetical protein
VVLIRRRDRARQKDKKSEKRLGIDCKNFEKDARTDEQELETMETEEIAQPNEDPVMAIA